MKTKRYLMYWHKMANSGLWGYNDLQQAIDVAKSFAKQEGMFDVHIIDTQSSNIASYKGNKIEVCKNED